MRAISRDSYEKEINMQSIVIEQVHFSQKNVFNFVQLGKDLDTTDLILRLNSLNNQGIIEINLASMYFIRNGVLLPLESLGSAEKFLLVCWIAVMLKSKVYLFTNIFKLRIEARHVLYDLLRKASGDVITFVLPSDVDRKVFERMVKKECSI